MLKQLANILRLISKIIILIILCIIFGSLIIFKNSINQFIYHYKPYEYNKFDIDYIKNYDNNETHKVYIKRLKIDENPRCSRNGWYSDYRDFV